MKKLWGVVQPTKLKQKLACILEADESTRNACGKFSTELSIRDHIAGKRRKIHYSTTILVSQVLFLCLKL